MLVIFGRYKLLARPLVGGALLTIGVVLHAALLALIGGAILAWGLAGLLSAWRAR